MPNTLTNLTNTIILDQAFEAFRAALAPLRAFSLNASPAESMRGDKVKVLSIPAQDPAINFAGTYTMQDTDADGIDVVLDKHKFVSMTFTDKELVERPQIEINRFAQQKGFQLAKAVLQDIWSVITLANYGAPVFTGLPATFDADDVVDIRTACASAGWPNNGRSLILAETYIGALLKDNAIQDASASGSTDPITNGSVRRICGFDLFESTLIPSNGQNLVGFAAMPQGVLVAMRYLSPQANHDYANVQLMTDPETGFTFGYREWYDNDSGATRAVIECLYGYVKGDGNAIKRIVSA